MSAFDRVVSLLDWPQRYRIAVRLRRVADRFAPFPAAAFHSGEIAPQIGSIERHFADNGTKLSLFAPRDSIIALRDAHGWLRTEGRRWMPSMADVVTDIAAEMRAAESLSNVASIRPVVPRKAMKVKPKGKTK